MTRTLRLVLALSLLAGCHSQAPFDPGTDCPKVAYCGQCASRGGCAWCGEAGDSGKGQCVAIGHVECAAPASWSKTPDHCPPPPAPTSAPTATASASSSPSPMAKIIGPERYAAIRTALTRAFPGANVTDEAVDGVAGVLVAAPKRTPAGGPKDERGREVAPITRHVKEKDHRLYLGEATHHRVKSTPPASRPMQSKFTMPLPMARVTLPEKLEGDAIIPTVIGDVDLSRDHLLGSIDLIAAKYGGKEYLGYRPGRVDLVTPARAVNTRFGAMAVYLGYRKKTDRGPSFYMLEAGTATGDARMIYFSPDMKPITSVTSYYLPTPFVTMRNTYSGSLTMRPAPDEDEPETLLVQSRVPGDKDPYITVTVQYRRAPEMDLPIPVEITADAAARIAMIAVTMGIASAIELQPVLADLAKTLHWEEIPRYTDPVAPSASAVPSAPPAQPPQPKP